MNLRVLHLFINCEMYHVVPHITVTCLTVDTELGLLHLSIDPESRTEPCTNTGSINIWLKK